MAPTEIPANAPPGSLLIVSFWTGLGPGGPNTLVLSVVVAPLKVRVEIDTDTSVLISTEVPLVAPVEDVLEEDIIVFPEEGVGDCVSVAENVVDVVIPERDTESVVGSH